MEEVAVDGIRPVPALLAAALRPQAAASGIGRGTSKEEGASPVGAGMNGDKDEGADDTCRTQRGRTAVTCLLRQFS